MSLAHSPAQEPIASRASNPHAGPNTTPTTTSTRPLTIALVSTQRGFRGGENQLRHLARGFREAGQRCLIYARRGRRWPNGWRTRALPSSRLPAVVIVRRHCGSCAGSCDATGRTCCTATIRTR